MSVEVESDDWVDIDRIWEAYSHLESATHSPGLMHLLSGEVVYDAWDEVETCWQASLSGAEYYASSYTLERQQLSACWDEITDMWISQPTSALLFDDSDSQQLEPTRFDECWGFLDPWWNAYSETGHETAIRLVELIGQSNEAWNEAAGSFDTDPISTKLSESSGLRGPLRPDGEVSWSQWLARILRPSGSLVSELLNLSVDHPPTDVTREPRVEKSDGTFRRPDILVFCEDRGVSIEVKIDDENYRKTAETARLVEQQYDKMDWDHVLLLPQRKQDALISVVNSDIEFQADGLSQIMWDDPAPINIIYWRDVTAALREVLQRGEAVDDQWAANAYLLCTVAEQQLIGFQPFPIIKNSVESEGFTAVVRPIGMVDILEEQLTYLTERLNS